MMLIGWDAADWKIINPLIEQGYMPNLEKLINGGTIGNLATMDPAYSPMLWTSIATGKHPYKHGIHGFLQPSEDRKSIKPILSTSRKVKAIWQILSEHDYKCHAVGWWPSHPAEEMNGISISNFYQKDNGLLADGWKMMSGCVHPDSEEDRFAALRVHPEELTGQHILPFIPSAEKIDQTKDTRIYSVAQVTAHAASIQAAFTNIIRTEEWDFAAAYFDSIDHYCHGFMKYHPPKQDHIAQNAFDLYNGVVTAAYRYHDMLLGRLMELAGKETTIILISDHGFQPDHLRPKYIPEEPGGAAYEHSPYGIIGMMGPGIKKDHLIYGAGLLDICPTILAHFGLSVGKDMDGKTLDDAYVKPLNTNYIDSWEAILFNKFKSHSNYEMDKDNESAMIEQLVALGYVNDISKDFTKAIKDTENFNNYNLAKSYLFGGKLDEAISVLEKLLRENPHIPRYRFHLASCYQTKGKLKESRALVNQLKEKEYYNPIALDMMEATLLMGEKKYKEALKLLKSIEDKVDKTQSHIFTKIAKCYLSTGFRDKAEEALKKEMELDYEYAPMHLMYGIIHYQKGNHDIAIEALLTSIGMEYNHAAAHRFLGLALFNKGAYQVAADSLEMSLRFNPKNNLARAKLIEIYKTHLDQPNKAALHSQNFHQNIKGEVIIVSGLPRSGTSMMMQMLDHAGIEIYTDKVREADSNNPKGYYEHNNVKSLRRNKRWVAESMDKAVKVISNFIPHLPLVYNYKIIFMERDLNEILASQRKMLQKLGAKDRHEEYPLQVMTSFKRGQDKAKQWASKQPNVEMIEVSYSDVINNPFGEALRISEFLDQRVTPEDLIKPIDANLYRQRKEVSRLNTL